jgi:hypothetical protein
MRFNRLARFTGSAAKLEGLSYLVSSGATPLLRENYCDRGYQWARQTPTFHASLNAKSVKGFCIVAIWLLPQLFTCWESSPIWQHLRAGVHCSEFELSEIARLLVRFSHIAS